MRCLGLILRATQRILQSGDFPFHRLCVIGGGLLDRLTHHVHILEMNSESYRLKRSREGSTSQSTEAPDNA